jgi:hypothetical protein
MSAITLFGKTLTSILVNGVKDAHDVPLNGGLSTGRGELTLFLSKQRKNMEMNMNISRTNSSTWLKKFQ